MTKRFSTRAMFYIISFITLVLLIGSAALQRIVFKADQVSSALSIVPASVNAKPGVAMSVRIHANFAGRATVAAAELVMNFDPTLLQVTNTISTSDWTTAKAETTDGTLRWVVVPRLGSVAEFLGDVTIGEVTFKTINEGKTALDLSSTETRIVAVDPGQTPSIYNSVATTQTATVSVSSMAVATPVATVPLPDSESQESTTGLQHFQSITEVVGTSTTQILVTTDQPSQVSVLFGPNPQTLLNSVVATTSEAATDLQLANLEAGATYYYRVRAEMAGGDTVLSKTRSFITAFPSSGAAFQNAGLVVFPLLAARNSTVYLTARASDGSLLTDLKPVLTAEKGNVTIGEVIASGGIYRVLLSSKLTSKQKVTIAASSNNQTIGRADIIFNPNLAPKSLPILATQAKITMNTTTLLTLLGLAGLLLILGLLFFRLARSK